MKQNRFLFLFLPLLALVITMIWGVSNVYADASHNIRGLASSTQGYISFNCLDDTFFGHFPMIFPFYFYVPPCSVSPHGVNLDDYNNFSGAAWSPALGYIYFDSSTTPDAPDYSFNVNCLNQCDSSNDCTACYNFNTQEVFGWAYREVPGDWVRLDSGLSPPVMMTNYSNPFPGQFYGYASSTIGNISFSCQTDGTCTTNNYFVYIKPLILQQMSAPNWSYSQACSDGAQRVVFQWLLKSGTQTGYRIIVNDTNTTSSPLWDSGPRTSTARQVACPTNCDGWAPDYNHSYYWWLQLWDYNSDPTPIFQFNRTTSGLLTNNIPYNDLVSPNKDLTFTSYLHEFPSPFFYWNPPDILVGTSSAFVSVSNYYTTANPNSSPQACVDGICDFSWSVSHPSTAIISSSSSSTTGIIFTDINPQIVTLDVTDSDNYQCASSSPSLLINFQLPLWKEVKAQ